MPLSYTELWNITARAAVVGLEACCEACKQPGPGDDHLEQRRQRVIGEAQLGRDRN